MVDARSVVKVVVVRYAVLVCQHTQFLLATHESAVGAYALVHLDITI